MEIKGSTIKRGKGPKATWWARIIYRDPETGKLRDLQRRAKSKADAGDLRDSLICDIKKTAGRSVGSERMTFADLCDYFEKHYIKPAEWRDDRKIAGVRSLVTAQCQLAALRNHFGKKRISAITHGSIRDFRITRLAEPTRSDFAKAKHAKQKTKPKSTRAIASVNRELSALRRMLGVATREGWLQSNPFQAGDSLISLADEKKRERILTRDEEGRLLAACDKPQRGHLKPIVICALDTGMRQGEILSLRWKDVDLVAGQINIQSFNTKTLEARQVALTIRLASELESLRSSAPNDSNLRVFGITDNVKRSFTGARHDAGLDDVRFHDLRHTAATRLVACHIPLSEVGRTLGHKQPLTTYRYVNANVDTARRAAAALDGFNAAAEPVEPEEGMTN
jgi:integrase